MTSVTKKQFKILAIGNSFSDNATKYLYSILKSFGVEEVVIGNLYIGGCSLKMHAENLLNDYPNYIYRKNTTGDFVNYENYKISDAINDEQWQYITFQQASYLSGKRDSYDYNLEYLINHLKRNALVGWHMTWAYETNATHPNFIDYESNQMKMYSDIIKCNKEVILLDKKIDFLIPAGTAIQNARTSYLGDTFTVDGFHLEPLGEFIVGLTWVLSITNWNISDMNLDLIPQELLPYFELCKNAAIKACENPFCVSDLSHLINPFADEELMLYDVKKDLIYSDISDLCKYDLYLPNRKAFDMVIHIHGGGLTGGDKADNDQEFLGKMLAQRGVAMASLNYRMYPNASYPLFIHDIANGVKAVFSYLKENDIKGKVYLSGQSAGAYLIMMLCFNENYLTSVGINPLEIAGWYIESGQPTTHFNVLNEVGLDSNLQRIDEKAPLYHVGPKTSFSKIILTSYTDDIKMRYEQNALLYQTIKFYKPNADINYLCYYGKHCANSGKIYRNRLTYADKVLAFIKEMK